MVPLHELSEGGPLLCNLHFSLVVQPLSCLLSRQNLLLCVFMETVTFLGASTLLPISLDPPVNLIRLRGPHGLGQLCQHHGWLNRPLWIGLGNIPLFITIFFFPYGEILCVPNTPLTGDLLEHNGSVQALQ